jgi:hypothetical protein
MKIKMRILMNGFAVVAGVLLLIGSGFRATAEDPPALPEIGLFLDAWRFDTTNQLTLRGDSPKGQAGVQLAETWNTNGARLAGSGPAYLQYNVVETNGWTNLSVPRGSIWFWFRPLWGSTNLGGTGPGSSVRLIELGAFTSDSSYGWLSIHLNSAGTRMYFAGQTNGNGAVYLEAPISWQSNTWHLTILDYTETNTALYVDGLLATNGAGVQYWPSPTVLSNGFFIGSDSSGSNLAQGDFELLRAYDGPRHASVYLGYYTNTLAKIEDWENGGDGLLGGGDGLGIDPGGGGSLGPGSGCTNGIQFLNPPVWVGTNLLLSLCGGVTNGVYDLYFITNLTPQRTWSFLGRSASPGQSGFLVSGLPMPHGFFYLGLTNDLDADGMTDAWEGLVSHTEPAVPQPPFKVFITEAVGGATP